MINEIIFSPPSTSAHFDKLGAGKRKNKISLLKE